MTSHSIVEGRHLGGMSSRDLILAPDIELFDCGL
jgi:hypothetical protein